MTWPLELRHRVRRLSPKLSGGIVAALAGLVRSMNCYYSNLIEGHDTHPIDIERALKKDYSADPEETRSLAARGRCRAHIAVQKWIDDGGSQKGATRSEAILEIHQTLRDLRPRPSMGRAPEDERKIRSFRESPVIATSKLARTRRDQPRRPPRFLRRFE